MENLNHALFLWINAPANPSALGLSLATFFAVYAIGIIPALIGIGWLQGRERIRNVVLEAAAAGLTGLTLCLIIGWLWPHPRPFMIGVGHTFLAHAADASFPSDHLTLLWSVAFSFLRHRRTCGVGIMLAVLGLPVAWARIYLGVHFPMDMAGAALVAALSAWLACRETHLYLPPAYKLATRLHHLLFSKFIARGWLRK